MNMAWMTLLIPTLAIVLLGIYLHFRTKRQNDDPSQQKLQTIHDKLIQLESQREQLQELLKNQQRDQLEQRQKFDQHQINSLKIIQDSLQKGSADARHQITTALNQHGEMIGKRMDKLTEETQLKLKEISGEVEKRLTAGFEKTTATFSDVMKRLTIIDEAQKKITELSSNVVSLQEVLSDRKARGAFGEVQLNNLIRNILPTANYTFQQTLSNGMRADCVLILPEPTGNIAIDAKFPLETYRHLIKQQLSDAEKHRLEAQFRKDIRKHIQDISEKYIIPGETSDGAVMFIPAEAVFSEIHANFPEIVDYAHQCRVWLASPTTMMAILTTACAALKDAATRKQVHIIQEHLVALNKDFARFQKRMDNLAKHIGKAHEDVELVHRSSLKISSRFSKIEKVELEDLAEEELALPSD